MLTQTILTAVLLLGASTAADVSDAQEDGLGPFACPSQAHKLTMQASPGPVGSGTKGPWYRTTPEFTPKIRLTPTGRGNPPTYGPRSTPHAELLPPNDDPVGEQPRRQPQAYYYTPPPVDPTQQLLIGGILLTVVIGLIGLFFICGMRIHERAKTEREAARHARIIATSNNDNNTNNNNGARRRCSYLYPNNNGHATSTDKQLLGTRNLGFDDD